MRFDLAGGHAFIVVPPRIIFPYMLKAEPIILVQAIAGTWRTVSCRTCAVGHVAAALRRVRVGIKRAGTGVPSLHHSLLFALQMLWSQGVSCHMTSLSESVSGLEPNLTRAQRVRKVLQTALFPTRLDLLDESHRHAHHVEQTRGPHAGATETHFRLYIVSPVFEGMSRVARSRKVHELLEPELADGLHALALTLRTPAEEEATA